MRRIEIAKDGHDEYYIYMENGIKLHCKDAGAAKILQEALRMNLKVPESLSRADKATIEVRRLHKKALNSYEDMQEVYKELGPIDIARNEPYDYALFEGIAAIVLKDYEYHIHRTIGGRDYHILITSLKEAPNHGY